MFSNNQPVVRVENARKCFHLYRHPSHRLIQPLLLGKKILFEQFWAVNHASFNLNKGQTLGIVGRNGSGKSTLLQMICKTLVPTEGSIQVEGRVGALLELGSGFDPEFTGLENIYMNGALLGMTRDEVEEKIEGILSFADIGTFVNQPVKTYSSGMTVRLAFAVQASCDPDILVVDEALAVGDELFQRKCYARLEELKARGTSILLVTHSCPQIVNHCDVAILMHQGWQRLSGDAKEVTDMYQRLNGCDEATWDAVLGQPNKERSHQPKANCKDANSLRDTGKEVEAEGDPSNKTAQDNTNKPTAPIEGWLEGLSPSSKVNYPCLGAEIISIDIVNKRGEPCDNMPARQDFIVRLCCRIDKPLNDARISCRITDISGLRITGQIWDSTASDDCNSGLKGLLKLGSGEAWIEFPVIGVLQPGMYFVSAGIWEGLKPEHGYTHRVTDAKAFRVRARTISQSFGICDLSAGPVRSGLTL
jgi:lipopolysaccharide transport system ATP-binding protein